MDNTEAMHIPQATRNARQLNGRLATLLQGQETTYKLSAVNVSVPPDELVDVPIFHPLRNKSEPVFAHCHSKKWQDVGVPEVFPSNPLSTESL